MTMRGILISLFFLASLAGSASAQSPYPPGPPSPVPALPDSARQTTYTISGTTCACSVGFQLYGDQVDVDAWIEVWVNGSRYLSTDPTFGWSLSTSVAGGFATAPRPITDAVLTFNNAQTGTVIIVGAQRPRRLTEYQEGQGVPARAQNQALNTLTSIERELWDKTNDLTGRGLFFAPGNQTGPMPTPAQCQNAFLGFNGTGTEPICVGSGGSISPPVPVDPALFGAAYIQTGIQASVTPVAFSGCTVVAAGSSYASPTATIIGNSYLGGTKGGSISFTLSGGTIASCSASGGSWTSSAQVKISDGTGSGGVVYPIVSLQTLNISAGQLNVNGVLVAVPSTTFTLTAAGAGSFGTYCLYVNIATGVWDSAHQAISSGCSVIANEQLVMTVTTSAWFGGEPATNNDIIAVNYWMKRAGLAGFDFFTTSKDFPVQTSTYLNQNTLAGTFAAPNVCALGVPGQNWGCAFNGNYFTYNDTDIEPIVGTNILDAGPVFDFWRVSTARANQNGDLLLSLNVHAETGNSSNEIEYGQILNRIVSVGTSGNSYNDAKGLWWFSTVGPDSQKQVVPRFEIGSGLYAGNESVGTVAHCGQFTNASGCVALIDKGAGTINLPGSVASNDFGNPSGYYLDNSIAFQKSVWTLYGSTSGSNTFQSDQNGTIGLGTSSPFAQSAWNNSLVVAAAQNSTTGILIYDASTGASVASALGLKTNTTNSYFQMTLSDGNGTPNMTMAVGNGTLAIPITYKFGQYIWQSVSGTQLAVLTSGFQIGSPTGGDKGAGTVNAAGAYYENGSQGLTQTCTVNQAKTLIFTGGILTGGTCNS